MMSLEILGAPLLTAALSCTLLVIAARDEGIESGTDSGDPPAPVAQASAAQAFAEPALAPEHEVAEVAQPVSRPD